MGVDAKIYLPGNCRLKTVIDVVAKLMDAPVEKVALGESHPGAWFARAKKGVANTKNYLPEMVTVEINNVDPTVVGSNSYEFGYHFEFGGYKNRGSTRGIIRRSRAFNLALLCRVAFFFGGIVDYQDCDDKDNDYEVPFKSDDMNCPEDGKPWQTLQERIMDIKPITLEEVASMEPFAAYHETESDVKERLRLKRKPYKAPKNS